MNIRNFKIILKVPEKIKLRRITNLRLKSTYGKHFYYGIRFIIEKVEGFTVFDETRERHSDDLDLKLGRA